MVSFKTVLACAALAVGSVMATGNILVNPLLGQVVNAGSKFQITWTPSGNDNVNLVLRKGDSAALNVVSTIATDIPNKGSYEWTVDKSLASGTDYAIEIQDTNNIADSNYSPYFTILTSGQGITSSAAKKAVSDTASGTDSAASATSAASSAKTSGASAASSAASGSVTSAASGSATSASGSPSASGSSSETATSASSAASSATSKTASASASKTSSSSGAAGLQVQAGVALLAIGGLAALC